MSFDAPPIVKLAERVMREVEEAVLRFPRYHKYQVGAEDFPWLRAIEAPRQFDYRLEGKQIAIRAGSL